MSYWETLRSVDSGILHGKHTSLKLSAYIGHDTNAEKHRCKQFSEALFKKSMLPEHTGIAKYKC